MVVKFEGHTVSPEIHTQLRLAQGRIARDTHRACHFEAKYGVSSRLPFLERAWAGRTFQSVPPSVPPRRNTRSEAHLRQFLADVS